MEPSDPLVYCCVFEVTQDEANLAIVVLGGNLPGPAIDLQGGWRAIGIVEGDDESPEAFYGGQVSFIRLVEVDVVLADGFEGEVVDHAVKLRG